MMRLDPKPAIPVRSKAEIPELARNSEPLRSAPHAQDAADQTGSAARRSCLVAVACAIGGGEAPACL
jgi:hypothetical protein